MIELIVQQVDEIKRLWKHKRQLIHQGLNLALVIISALMIWKGLTYLSKSEAPVVVVLSGSMEPAFQRGDILCLNNNKHFIETGDIVVFKIVGREIPIVHRVLELHRSAETDENIYLTKGDNNNVHDRGLYAENQLWLNRTDIIGVVNSSVPYAGMMTILLNDYPLFKYALLGIMGFLVLTQRE
ncbi:hypothetical protein ABG067_000207 [Albugo candida]